MRALRSTRPSSTPPPRPSAQTPGSAAGRPPRLRLPPRRPSRQPQQPRPRPRPRQTPPTQRLRIRSGPAAGAASPRPAARAKARWRPAQTQRLPPTATAARGRRRRTRRRRLPRAPRTLLPRPPPRPLISLMPKPRRRRRRRCRRRTDPLKCPRIGRSSTSPTHRGRLPDAVLVDKWPRPRFGVELTTQPDAKTRQVVVSGSGCSFLSFEFGPRRGLNSGGTTGAGCWSL